MKEEERNKNYLEKRVGVKMALIIAAPIALLATAFVYFKYLPPAKGMYIDFARCIKASGAIFYGAFWCPHCENEKKLFGDSAQFLPYVECSTPDGRNQSQVCKDASVKNYPTWVFGDGSRLTGEVPLGQLAEKTGCAMPTSIR